MKGKEINTCNSFHPITLAEPKATNYCGSQRREILSAEMRCSHYVPTVRRTKPVSARPEETAENPKNTSPSALHQPSNNLELPLQPTRSPAQRPSTARGSSRKCASTFASTSGSAIKRALRDSAAKSQVSFCVGDGRSVFFFGFVGACIRVRMCSGVEFLYGK